MQTLLLCCKKKSQTTNFPVINPVLTRKQKNSTALPTLYSAVLLSREFASTMLCYLCVNQTGFTQSESLSYWSYQAMQTSDREGKTTWEYERCSSFQLVNKTQVRGTTTLNIRHIYTQHFNQRTWVHDLCDSRVALLAKFWVSLETPWISYSHERQGKLVANQTISLPRGVGPTTLLQQILLNS